MCNTVYFILVFSKRKKKKNKDQAAFDQKLPITASLLVIHLEFRMHVFDVDVCIRSSEGRRYAESCSQDQKQPLPVLQKKAISRERMAFLMVQKKKKKKLPLRLDRSCSSTL